MLYTLKQWCAVGFSLPSQKEPTDSSNTGVNISLATEADVEDLALVCTKAIETDLLHGLIHQRGKTEHAVFHTELAHLELLVAIRDPKERIFKAR